MATRSCARWPTDENKMSETNGKVKTENGNLTYPLRAPRLPSVALGSATLRGHRMTSSHSSKDPLRPLTQRDSQLQ